MIVYFDTSALAKLFLHEDGTEAVRDLWTGSSTRVTSVATYPEARAAIAGAARSSRIGRGAARRAVTELEGRLQTMDVVILDEELSLSAGHLAETFGLRGYDAVHLATARSLDGGTTVVATWDAARAQAAERSGLGVASS